LAPAPLCDSGWELESCGGFELGVFRDHEERPVPCAHNKFRVDSINEPVKALNPLKKLIFQLCSVPEGYVFLLARKEEVSEIVTRRLSINTVREQDLGAGPKPRVVKYSVQLFARVSNEGNSGSLFF
jgi:hypothetical protein